MTDRSFSIGSKIDYILCVSLKACLQQSQETFSTRKNTQRYYTPKRLKIYLLPNCFFAQGGKSKADTDAQRTTDWSNQFLYSTYKITNCLNNRTISQDFCTLLFTVEQFSLCQLGESGIGSIINLMIDLFLILITCLHDIVWKQGGEILSWSQRELKG